MMKKILDKKGRKMDDVIIYTGLVPDGVNEEEWRKKNKTFPKNGYYLSPESLFRNVPPDGDFMTFHPKDSISLNIKYRGAQFLRKDNKLQWLYFVDKTKLKKFNYIISGHIEYSLVDYMVRINGYTDKIYSYAYINDNETMTCNFYYNPNRNVILKLETNEFLNVIAKLYCPKGILPSNLIFKLTPTFLIKDWLYDSKINVRKMVKPTGMKMNKNQLDYVEKSVVEILMEL